MAVTGIHSKGRNAKIWKYTISLSRTPPCVTVPTRVVSELSCYRFFLLGDTRLRRKKFARRFRSTRTRRLRQTQMILVLRDSGTRRTWSIVTVCSLDNKVVSSFTFYLSSEKERRKPWPFLCRNGHGPDEELSCPYCAPFLTPPTRSRVRSTSFIGSQNW